MSKNFDSHDGSDGSSDDEFLPPTAEQIQYLRRLGNPYAKDSVTLRAKEAPKAAKVAATTSTEGTISQAAFDFECRQILGGYMPEMEKGRLRPHYTDFIKRNKSQAPSIRFQILARLRKFDLSDMVGLEPRFNREKDVLTEAKLREIERASGVKQ